MVHGTEGEFIMAEEIKDKYEDKYCNVTIDTTDNASICMQLMKFYLDPKEFLGEDIYNKVFDRNMEYLKNHQEIKDKLEDYPWNGWYFRGQRVSTWPLVTSFERWVHNKIMHKDYFEIEMGMIREFKRTVHLYAPELQSLKEDELYEWIANMQHYGCYTRFLDVSYSFFIALYFAIWHIGLEDYKEENKENHKEFSIWCFNRMWIEKEYKNQKNMPSEILDLYKNDKFGKDPKIQKTVLNYIPNLKKNCIGDYKQKFLSVINMTPFIMNTRLVRQQGSFLFPTNPYVSFGDIKWELYTQKLR